jgi:hypothetical protein
LKKLRYTLIISFGLFSFICLLNGNAYVQPVVNSGSLLFSFTEVVGLISGIISLFLIVVGFLLRRSVFGELDKIDEKKQDKSMCEQIEETACRDRDEMKKSLKDGALEFKSVQRKIDRIMWRLKLPPDDGEERDKNTDH